MNKIDYKNYETIYNEFVRMEKEGETREYFKCLKEIENIKDLGNLNDFIEMTKDYNEIMSIEADLLTIIRIYESL